MAKKNKHRKKHFRFTNTIAIVSLVGVLLASLVFWFVLHQSHYLTYDSSEDGSEIAEEQQNTVPPDVLAQINKQDVASAQNTNVLGAETNKTPYPIPTGIRVPIIMYHYVEHVQDPGDTKRISLNTTPETLDSEIKALVDAGYTFMTNKELTAVLNGEAKLPQKPVLLTFDDGYRDFYTDAYPILKKYNAKATEYVIAGFLDRPNHLLTSQLEEIAKDGLVEIGAHTVNHIWLKGEDAKTVDYEITQSKAMLEKLINKPVVSFAYPFGAFDLQAYDDVQKAGYTSAVSTIPGDEQNDQNKYFLFRLRPGGRSGQDLINFISQDSFKQ